MDNNMASALLQQRLSDFIEKRTIIENELTRFLQSLDALDDATKEQIGYTPGHTARTLLPALWEEDFDLTKYNEQLSNYKAWEERIRLVMDEINQEAARCLQE